MRILAFNWKDITHPFAGGAEHHIHQQAKLWVKQGHTVTLYCPRYKGSKQQETIDGVHIHRAGGRFGTYFLAPLHYFLYFRNKYDVILDVENGIPFFTPLFSTKPKVLVMHHVHKNVFFKELPKLIAFLPYIAEQYIMPLLYRTIPIIAASESTKKETIKLGIPAKNITVIHNGFLIQPAKKTPKEKKPTIIYLGRMMHYKRLDILLRIFQTIQKEIPGAQLLLVGTGEALPLLKKTVHEQHISHVLFYDFVTEQTKKQLLERAWLYVTPSSLEGWGITVIEANACGLPAIAFNVPGLNEAIQNNTTGYLVRNEHDMQEKITILLTNKTLRTRLGENAKTWSKNFSWETTAKKTLQLLQKITQ